LTAFGEALTLPAVPKAARMRRAALLCAVAGSLLCFSSNHGASPRALVVGHEERLLVIAPHPDDETLGAGGLVQRVLSQGGRARVVILTAGDGFVRAVEGARAGQPARPAEYVAYGERRIDEAESAIRVLGRGRVRVDVLGFPDAGLIPLLSAHWKRSEPARSPTTGAMDPPYDEAYAPDVPYAGTNLRAELIRILRATKPTLVAMPDPLDAHPDHRATGLFALLALDEWTREAARHGDAVPQVLAYLVHWPGWPSGWSETPGAETRRALLAFPATLPTRDLDRVQLVLDPAEVATKQNALRRYGTQRQVMDAFLLNFARASEPFTVLTRRELRGDDWVRDLRLASDRTQVARSR
jgi:LmbE family N-acetylglucosaminyl deacetylase